jgi:uncharacterized protein (TIGR02268 family)
MRPCSSAIPLALLLLVTASVARAQPPPCQKPIRHVELATSPGSPPELCISPGQTSTLVFDQELAQGPVELEGQERFQLVQAASNVLVLLPSERLTPGERLQLKVRFTEGGPAASAAFVLVVYRDEAEQQVKISSPPAPGTCQAELRRQEEELRRCLSQSARPPLEAMDSLAALLRGNVIDPELTTFRELTSPSLLPAPVEGVTVAKAALHRSRSRFVVRLQVANTGVGKPWMAEGAHLLSTSGERLKPLWVLQRDAVEEGDFGQVWVEFTVSATGPIGPFTLEVWDGERTRTLTLKGLRLP